MRKTLLTLSLALAMVFGLCTGVAQAQTTDLGNGWTQVTSARMVINDCPNGYICLFKDAYGWGTRCQTTVTGIRGGATVPSACANNASSSYNRTAWNVVWFNGAHCESNLAKREDGPQYAQSDWETRDFDNEISSWASRANWAGEYC
jgi:peptidase inhibitor family I36